MMARERRNKNADEAEKEKEKEKRKKIKVADQSERFDGIHTKAVSVSVSSIWNFKSGRASNEQKPISRIILSGSNVGASVQYA